MAEPHSAAEKTSEGSVAESAPEGRQRDAWIAGKMTPCLQVTDTDFAFLVKCAARNEEQVVKQELKQSAVEEPTQPVATEPAAVEEPPKAVATEEPPKPAADEEPPKEASSCRRMRTSRIFEGEQGFPHDLVLKIKNNKSKILTSCWTLGNT